MRFTNLVPTGVLMAGVLLGGCASEDSNTDLNPDGPPMVRQVFMQERVTLNVNGNMSTVNRTQLAFGTHPDISEEDDDGQVINALALDNKIRIIVDELLDGSTLEQVACADGTFSDIPSGTTPDDIADCAGLDRSDCTAVCTQIDTTTNQPTGILDEDEDLAADGFRFKDNIVTLFCNGEQMPLSIDESFYNPSGNQQIPAGSIGVGGLGPALVIVPDGMRTGSACNIEIADSVVDKSGNAICAPPGGDITNDCPGAGDTSLLTFNTQVFALRASSPRADQENFNPASTPLLQFNMEAMTDAANLANITLVEDGVGPVAGATIVVEADDPATITIPVTGGLKPSTAYTITIEAGFTEIFGGTLAEQVVIGFTTRDEAVVPDAAPEADAGLIDAMP